MAGIQNNIIYGGGYKLQTSSARDISDMQMLASDVSKVNHIGSPEGVVSANPSSLCHDPVSGIVYIKQTGVGNTGWAVLSTSTTGLNTLTDDVGTVITPSLTNIQLVGHVVEQGSTKFSTVVQGAAIANINPMASSRWIVDPLGFNGTHTTIQAAINAATSGDNVFIMEGVYTTDLTLKAGVNLVAYRGSGRTSTVTIIGNCTFNTAGTTTISGCRLQTNGSFCISNTGTLASILNIIDCDIQASNNTAINFTNSNAASQIFISISTMNLGTTGIAIHAMTSVGTLQYRYCNISNTGASTTASSNSAGTVIFYYCNVFSPLATTATGVIQKRYSYVDTSAQNVTCLTTAGTGTTEIDFGGDSSGTATAIVVGAGTTVLVNSTNIYSNNAEAISGAGTLNFSLLTFEGTSSAITVTTQIPRVTSNDSVVIKTPGAYPYTTIPQDGVILVDTSVARTITPLASPTKGQMHRIKDSVGSAATNNITITPSGKNIDGAASKIINTNYGSIDIVYNGTEWSTLTSGASGTVTSVSGTLNRVTVTAGSAPVVDISASYVGQTSITTLGTVTTGVWNGTAINETHGGTNQTTYVTGDTLYASASNTLSKLPIGTTGQVYTVAGGVPSWANASGGGGAWNLISTKSASASSSINFTSGITSTYNNYVIIASNVKVSSFGTVSVQFSIDGGSTYLSSSYLSGVNQWSYTTATNTNTNSSTGIIITTSGDNTSYCSSYAYLNNLTSGIDLPQVFADGVKAGTATLSRFYSCGCYTSALAINAIQLIPSAGTITTGTFSLYGISQ